MFIELFLSLNTFWFVFMNKILSYFDFWRKLNHIIIEILRYLLDIDFEAETQL